MAAVTHAPRDKSRGRGLLPHMVTPPCHVTYDVGMTFDPEDIVRHLVTARKMVTFNLT